jgi:hypothetical protein
MGLVVQVSRKLRVVLMPVVWVEAAVVAELRVVPAL